MLNMLNLKIIPNIVILNLMLYSNILVLFLNSIFVVNFRTGNFNTVLICIKRMVVY